MRQGKIKTKNLRQIILLSLLSLFLIFGSAQAAPGVPKILNHQGRLLDSAGNLLGGAGADFCFKFSIYDDALLGAPDIKLWPSVEPSIMTINVKNGVFNAEIGNVSQGGDILDFNFQDSDEIYLNTRVANKVGASCLDGDEVFENLSPRQRVVSSGYTINTDTVDGFHAAQSAFGNQIPALSSGNFILGGINPQVNATGTNTLTLQGGGGTGDIQFFSSTNKITSAGNLTVAGAVSGAALNVTGFYATSTFSTGGLAVGGNQFVIQQASGFAGFGTSTPQEKMHLADGSFVQDSPLNPKIVGGQNLALPGGGSQQIFVSGNYAYVIFNNAAGTDILRVIDISDPANPAVAGGSNLSLPGYPRSIYVAGRYGYLIFRNGAGADNFRIVDISNSKNPAVVGGGALNLPANGQHIFVAGRYVYATFDNGAGVETFRIIDVANPARPTVVGGAALSLPAAPRQVYVKDKYAYVAFYNTVNTDALRIIDVSEPKNPAVVGGATLPLGYSGWGIFVAGRYVYVTFDNDGSLGGVNIFRIVDVADPTSPAIAGGDNLVLPPFAKSVFISGRYGYIAFDNPAGSQGFRIIDVLNPAAPVIVGGNNLTLPGFPKSVFIKGRYGYLVFYQGAGVETFRAVDISGLEAVSVNAHSLEAGSLQVAASARIQNQLIVGGGINMSGGLNARGAVGMSGNVSIAPPANSSSTFYIQNAAGSETLFNVDTQDNLVRIGDGSGAGSQTSVLVLDNKTDAGDPLGMNGAIYFSSSTQKFRCFENSAWRDCDSRYRTFTLLSDATGVAMTNPAAAPGTEMSNLVSRRKIYLKEMTNCRGQFASSLTSSIIKLNLQYSLDQSSWYDLCPDVTAVTAANGLSVGAPDAIPEQAKTDVYVRAMIVGNGVLDPTIRYVSLDVN